MQTQALKACMGSLSGCVQGSDTCQTCLCAGEEVCVIAVHHRRTPLDAANWLAPVCSCLRTSTA